MFVGPFDGYTPVDDEHVELTKRVLKPISIGQYSPATLRVKVRRDQIVTKDGKIYVETDDPWLEALGNADRLIIPAANPDGSLETVVPVRYIEKSPNYEKFYGYYVVIDSSGEVVSVKGAGIYERVIPSKLADAVHILPVNVVKDFTELDKREFIALARYTPPQLLAAIDRAGRRDIVSAHIAEMLRRDPLALVDYPEQIVRKYIVDEQDAVVKMAMMENTPMMMKVFINELMTRGYDASKLALLLLREEEEEKEDEQLEKMRMEAIKRAEKQMQVLRENFGEMIKAVYDVTLPLTVIAPFAVVAYREKNAKARRGRTEEEKVEEVYQY